MGIIKKLVVGFFLLLFLGIAAIFGMQYYYDTAYDKVPVEVKTETVSGDVFYLSHVLEPGTYKITAEGEGTVEKIYGSTQPFQVRIDYKAPVGVDSYGVKIEIYRLVEK